MGDTPSAGDSRTDDKGIAQVFVPPGCFIMGTDYKEAQALIKTLNAPSWVASALQYESPARETCLTKGYWIDTYEVTNKAYGAFVEDGGYTTEAHWSPDGLKWLKRQNVSKLPLPCEFSEDDFPRLCVTWYEAEAYAHWRGGRLPTEAEWEFAARGTESLMYPWGNEFDPLKANVVWTKAPMPVGSYPEGISWVGAHDMAGNAMEWVADWLSADYPRLKIKEDPTGPESGLRKMEKGGWWGSNGFVARSAYKHFEDPPNYQDHHIGFRIVTPLEESIAEKQP